MANKYQDRPYEVGKGKPPTASQFKPGHKPSPRAGRPKGAKGINVLRKILNERIQLPDKNGKMVWVTLEEAMGKRLIHKALQDGNLAAISLVFKAVLEMEKFEASRGPTAEEIRQQQKEEEEEEEEKREIAARLSKAMIEHLDLIAQLKRLGLLVSDNDRFSIAGWAFDAADEHAASQPQPGYRPPEEPAPG